MASTASFEGANFSSAIECMAEAGGIFLGGVLSQSKKYGFVVLRPTIGIFDFKQEAIVKRLSFFGSALDTCGGGLSWMMRSRR
jgi:hypothetical protein